LVNPKQSTGRPAHLTCAGRSIFKSETSAAKAARFRGAGGTTEVVPFPSLPFHISNRLRRGWSRVLAEFESLTARLKSRHLPKRGFAAQIDI
jgi:hypothetical protein